MKKESQMFLDSLDKQQLLAIIKYGLRNSNCPSDITVEDIYTAIGCNYIQEA